MEFRLDTVNLKNKNAGDHSQEKTTEKTILRLSLACTFLHSLGHKQTHAPQQIIPSFDHVVSEL